MAVFKVYLVPEFSLFYNILLTQSPGGSFMHFLLKVYMSDFCIKNRPPRSVENALEAKLKALESARAKKH